MRKSKVVRLVVGVFLLLVVILILNAGVFASSTGKMSLHNGNVASTDNTISSRKQPAPAASKPIVVPMQHATSTAAPPHSPPGVSTAPPPQQSAPPSAAPAISSDRYFPATMAIAAMKSVATNLTKQQVKVLLEQQVDALWGTIQNKLGFSTKEKAYAFFLGMATRESTFNAALETGSGPSHSYGPLQAAEPAYANTGQNYSPENDVLEIVQYDFTPQNFYDPGIAIHMGIRHLLHFSNQARAAGYAGTELLRHALIGYNTGVIESSNPSWMQQYSDEIGALAGWYLNTGHLYDAAFTWTGNSTVNRNNFWGWY